MKIRDIHDIIHTHTTAEVENSFFGYNFHGKKKTEKLEGDKNDMNH